MSGSVEVGSGAHMSRKDARTGRIATVRRSGVMYAIAPVYAWHVSSCVQCTYSAHAVHAQCTCSARQHLVHTGRPSHLEPGCAATQRRDRHGQGACR